MKLTILGSSASTPKVNKYTTSQFLKIRNHHILIDCGEGIQMQLRKLKINFSKISHIFISHLHGDHYFGLPGLISTMNLLGRTRDLHLFGPAGLIRILELQFELAKTFLSFSLKFTSVEQEEESQ